MGKLRRIRLTEPPKFKNVVEKQRYYDALAARYGDAVKGRQDFVFSYDKALPGLVPSHQAEIEAEYTQKELGTSPPDYPSDTRLYDQSPPPSIHQTWKGVIERNKGRLKVNPTLLYASLMEEGGNKQMLDQGKYSQVHGGLSFGLDTIGDRADEFIKKGYLDPNFKRRMSTSDFVNEKGRKSISAYFNTYDDVLMAKQAFMLAARDAATEQAKKLKVNLSPKAIDYLTMVGYNFGEGGMKQMMVDMAKQGAFENDKFEDPNILKDEYVVPRRNASRRLKLAEMLQNELFGTPTSIAPPTPQKGKKP